MFVGHFAVALAARRAAPPISLGMLFFACQLADLVWPTLVLVGVEQLAIAPGSTAVTPIDFLSYPYSHSLLALAGWGVLAGVIYRTASGACRGAVVLIASVVASHWVLDWITHRPDMPLTPWGDVRVGLGLWRSIPGTMAVEAALLAIGLVFYTRATRAKDRIGSIGFWSLIGVLVLISIANVLSPPPPSPEAVVWSAQGLWLFVLWAFWVDRHRE